MAVHRIRKGLDLPLAGEPAQAVDARAAGPRGWRSSAPTTSASSRRCSCSRASACCAARRCSRTSRRPGVRYTAPAAGTVAAIHRGEMRALPVDRHRRRSGRRPRRRRSPSRATRAAAGDAATPTPCARCSSNPGCGRHCARGPFSPRAVAVDAAPHAIFVTAIDTRPHAPAVDVVLAGRDGRFRTPASPRCAKLCAGHDLRLRGGGLAPSRRRRRRASSSRNSRARIRPATPGLHIHLLDPVDLGTHRLAHRLPGRRRDRPARHDRAARRRARDLARPGPASRARACCARASARRSTR